MKDKKEETAVNKEDTGLSDEAENGETIPEPEVNELEKLKSELEAEKARADENYNKYLRALADADNQRKRWLKEKEELLKYAGLPVLKQMLTVLDDIQRARQAAEKGGELAAILKGIEMIEKRIKEILENEGLRPIPGVGEMFDPRLHEALHTEETNEHPEGTILEEYRTGYMLGERVARPSLVKVAKNVEPGLQDDSKQGQ